MSRQNNALPQMVEPLWSTYIHQKGARLGLPVTGTFELTPRCNFNCNMCYVHQTETQAAQGGRRELTTAEWLAIAEEARKAGMVFLLLTGGEPLLRPDFPELLHALKNMGFLVSVNSNGSLLRGKLLEAVKQDPPLRFNITLYGGSRRSFSFPRSFSWPRCAFLCGVPTIRSPSRPTASPQTRQRGRCAWR